MSSLVTKEESTTTIECASCGCTIEDPDSGGAYWHEDYQSDICAECLYRETNTCQLCGEDSIMPSDTSAFIVVKHELARTCDRPPGIYRILSHPFLSIPLVGSGSLHATDVCFVDRLPKKDREFEISGHICTGCAKPYRDLWRRHYQYAPKNRRGWGIHSLWDVERRRTRRILQRHPEMLRDLECHHFDRWDHRCPDVTDLENIYSIKIRAKTHHDWLLLEHKGVKIYGCSSPRPDLTHWLLLSPDPKYRYLIVPANQWNLVLTATSLPTYPELAEEESLAFEDHHTKNIKCRAAILAAIDEGLLTQSGVFDRTGHPIRCG